jgi:hypothetical protein
MSEQEGDADFAAVRGTMEGNAVIRKMTQEGEEITRRGTELRTLIERAS